MTANLKALDVSQAARIARVSDRAAITVEAWAEITRGDNDLARTRRLIGLLRSAAEMLTPTKAWAGLEMDLGSTANEDRAWRLRRAAAALAPTPWASVGLDLVARWVGDCLTLRLESEMAAEAALEVTAAVSLEIAPQGYAPLPRWIQ